MELVGINTAAAREHVGEYEWAIWYLKERSRYSVSTLSAVGIEYLRKPVIICLVYNVTLFVNAVPDSLGVSERYLPHEIMTHQKFDFA